MSLPLVPQDWVGLAWTSVSRSSSNVCIGCVDCWFFSSLGSLLDFFLVVFLTHSVLHTSVAVRSRLPVFHGHKIHACPRQEWGDHSLLEGGARVRQGLLGLRDRNRLKRRFLCSGSEVASQVPRAMCPVSRVPCPILSPSFLICCTSPSTRALHPGSWPSGPTGLKRGWGCSTE